MMIGLFRRKITGVNFNGIWRFDYYKLPDMNYGGFLIYQGIIPKYYINFLDEKFIKMGDYLKENHIDAEQLLKQILSKSSVRDLSLQPKCQWFAYKFGKEEPVEYEMEEFPIRIWDEIKDKL